MVTIRNHYPGVVGPHGNHHRFCVTKRVYFTPVHYCFYFQKTEQHLILSLQDNMIGGSNNLLFC